MLTTETSMLRWLAKKGGYLEFRRFIARPKYVALCSLVDRGLVCTAGEPSFTAGAIYWLTARGVARIRARWPALMNDRLLAYEHQAINERASEGKHADLD